MKQRFHPSAAHAENTHRCPPRGRAAPAGGPVIRVLDLHDGVVGSRRAAPASEGAVRARPRDWETSTRSHNSGRALICSVGVPWWYVLTGSCTDVTYHDIEEPPDTRLASQA